MKEYLIKISEDGIFINDEKTECETMDKTNSEDDRNKKALVSLASLMGYEPVFLFKEMVDRLYEMVDDITIADNSPSSPIYVRTYETNSDIEDTIPSNGELVVYLPDNDHAYDRYKVGDGRTKLSELPFVPFIQT